MQTTFNETPIESQTNEEEAMVRKRYGFLPTSVWYLTKTQGLLKLVEDNIGTGSYGDGNPLSQFNPVVAEKIIKIWSKEGEKILDPFAGRCRAIMARHLNRHYRGYEISPKAYSQLQANLNRNSLHLWTGETYKCVPVLCNQDSRLMVEPDEEYDLIFSCPPFWDVEDYNEQYGEHELGQLSDIHDYDKFLADYKIIIANCYKALKTGKYAVWVVADIRRNKTLIPFHADTIRIFQEVGFACHDVIVNQLNSLAIMGIGQALENKYTPKMHEYILVFKK
jgi:DNA modification methylase